MVYCLSIDLIGSTEAGLELSSSALDRFNLSLVSQISPHLEAIGLNEVILKFTGDGWLVMSEQPNQAEALCCLATIMAHTFQIEMSRKTGIPTEKIPLLRLAICAGRDMHVELPDKRHDWVGDSARRAVRAARYCSANEILIDETIKYIVFRNFHTERIDIDHRSLPNTIKREESFALYSLGDLKIEAANDSQAPEYFINMLSIIGKHKDAAMFAKKASEQVEREVHSPTADRTQLLLRINRILSSRLGFSKSSGLLTRLKEVGLSPDLLTYNLLLRKAPDINTAEKILREMRERGFNPNVFTYNMLITLSSNYENAKIWWEKMLGEDIKPDVVTYTSLIRKIPDSEFSTAKSFVEKMVSDGVAPDIAFYTQLIRKAQNFEEIELLVKTIREKGLEPDRITYKALISKVPDVSKARKLLEEMSERGLQREFFTFNISHDYSVTSAWVETLLEEGLRPDLVTLAELINRAPNYADAKTWVHMMKQNGIVPDLSIYNILIRRALDFEEAQSWMNTIRESGLHADQTTYRRLIRKAPTITSARRLLLEMRGEGLTPKPYIYRLLIEKCSTHECRKQILHEMQNCDIKRDTGTYYALVLGSESYDEAKIWIEAMLNDGILKIGPYCALFRKDLSNKNAGEILRWHLENDYHPQEPIQAAIASFVRADKIDQAFRLALDYPHLGVSRKLIRHHRDEALSYFRGVYARETENPNSSYALGTALLELGQETEAEPYLRKALKLANKGGPRRKLLNEWLHQLETKQKAATSG